MKRLSIGLIDTSQRSRWYDLDPKYVDSQAKLIESYFPNTRATTYFVKEYSGGPYDENSYLEITAPRVNELIKSLESEQLDVIIIDCCGDPGLEEAKKRLDVPVVGAGSATAALALQYGDRVGVLGERPVIGAPHCMRRILGNHLVAVDNPSRGKIVYDLLKVESREDIIEAAKRIKQRKVDVIALGCTGYSRVPWNVAQTLTEILGILTIDPVIAACSVGLGLVYAKILM